MKSRPTANPTNRFHDTAVSYDEGDGPPPAQVKLIEDHSRTIIANNDSPDIGFDHSVNPYRGCLHACAYCLDGATQILLGDGRTRAIADLKPGDEIYGTRLDGEYRYYTRTRVLDHWRTRKPAFRITLADGTELVASGDHRFLSDRGWKHVMPAEGTEQRPSLTTNNSLIGTGKFASKPVETEDYKRGYLCGMIRGDATLKRYDYSGRRRGSDVLYQFRLALVDLEALHRSQRYLGESEVETSEFVFAAAHGNYRATHGIRTATRDNFDRIALESNPSKCWSKGFLAGIFDAEGSRSTGIFRISNIDERILDTTRAALSRFGFDNVLEGPRENGVYNIRLRGGRSEHLRFYHSIGPAISRKWDLEGSALKSENDLSVVSIEPIGERDLFDITTGTSDFIANGVVSHNCFARPSHEYLDMGAGTDFDTKIVVKPQAAQLLRDAFEKPSWKGELLMFSGVTDCYQAVESQLQLTKQCLEVCVEYKNPVAIITKSALIERDLELLVELNRVAGVHLSVSVAWVDAKLARAFEPWAPAPERRFKVLEKFAKAGIPVGVMCAPIMPGLNDDQMVRVLERAKDAGAQTAGWVLLRLPGAVATVFEERVREVMPLAADKIMHRIRETRGGEKLYDPRWGKRGRGEGVYAQTIATMFDTTVKRLGLNGGEDRYLTALPKLPTFARPEKPKIQLSLF